MLEINIISTEKVSYFEAIFVGGNLYAYSLVDMLRQLKEIHGLNVPLLTQFNLN